MKLDHYHFHHAHACCHVACGSIRLSAPAAATYFGISGRVVWEWRHIFVPRDHPSGAFTVAVRGRGSSLREVQFLCASFGASYPLFSVCLWLSCVVSLTAQPESETRNRPSNLHVANSIQTVQHFDPQQTVQRARQLQSSGPRRILEE